MSTYGLLHPKYIFGLNGNCKGTNVHFIDSNTIVYPVGNTVVMYNLDQKTQNFLHGVEKGRGVTSLAVSSTKVYCAVAQLGEKPSISIFDLKLNKRKKTLIFNDMTSTEYISLAFSMDCMHLASLSNGPEFALYFWKWDKGRMLCQAKTTGGAGPVYEISGSPIENSVMCAVGRASFRFFRYGDGHMKPFGFQKGDSYHFLCHAWLGKGDRLIAGTRDGKLMYFERGDYRYEILIPSMGQEKHLGGDGSGVILNNMVQYGGVGGGGGDESGRGSPVSKRSTTSTVYEVKGITALVPYSKGFICGYGSGFCIVYEEQVSFEVPEEHYKPLHIIRVPFSTPEPGDRVIKSLTINTTEEVIVATTANSQLLTFSLASAEIKDPKEMYFEYALASFHYGAVVALDVSVRKSLFVTAGADKFIRVWNYITMTLDASREFSEEIFCVSLHPTGLFILAGCADKIRLFSIVMDDIREMKDFPIRGCREAVFSNGGHLFAIANGNIIQIYTTTSFENIGSMKGHSNKVRRLRWGPDDSVLVSIGSDGAIYEWDVVSMRRESDYVERGTDLLDSTTSPDGKTHYAIAGSGGLKEIQIQDGILLKEVNLEMVPKCIKMSRSGRVLVVGMTDGIVRSLRQPLTYSNEWFDFRIHYDTINAIRITFDEVYCISVSEDGSIILWKITDPEGRTSKMENEILYSNEVLITKSDLDEQALVLRELRQKFGELRLEMEYQMKRKEMSYLEELKSSSLKTTQEITNLNAKIEELVGAKEESDLQHYGFVSELGEEQAESVRNIEAHYKTRLISEFEKYNELQVLLQQTIQEYEGKLKNLDNDCEQAVEELVEYFEGKIKDKSAALGEAYDEARQTLTESEEMKKQIEEDADTEILQLRTAYERKLQREKNLNAKLRTDSSIMKKNFGVMNREIEEQKAEVSGLRSEGAKLRTVIASTEKEVQGLRKDLVDRDVNVMGKEKVIHDLKNINSELEKYKYVLEYKVKELEKMIEPKEREIIYLKQQNADMEAELSTTVAVRNGLELQVNELSNKLKVTDSEYGGEKVMRWRLEVLVDRIRSYMSRCMNVLQDHNSLKTHVMNMYKRYGNSMNVGIANNAEQEAICELVRQKNYLEMCLASLKRKMSSEVDFTRNEQLKIMHENMLLVSEINGLRRELKSTRDRAVSYEKCLGILPSNFNNAKTTDMKLRLHNAIQERDEIGIKYEKTIEAKENVIEAQSHEIEYLSDKLLKVQEDAGMIDEDNSSNKD